MDILLYGYESNHVSVIVVSLIGSICTTFCFVADAHVMNVFRSPKSPTPKLPSERSENTGMAHPATRKLRVLKKTSVSGGKYVSPRCKGCVWNIRLFRVSHATTAPVLLLTATNLYSKGNFSDEASTVSCHMLGRTSRIRMGRQYSQLPKALQLPIRPSDCSLLLSPGHKARNVMQLPTLSFSLTGLTGVYFPLNAELYW